LKANCLKMTVNLVPFCRSGTLLKKIYITIIDIKFDRLMALGAVSSAVFHSQNCILLSPQTLMIFSVHLSLISETGFL
jgi:hypothetical protein